MIGLHDVKQQLRDNHPFVYQKIRRFYRMTPHAKHRNAQRVATENEIRRKMHYRAGYESKIIKEYLNDDWTVRHGPFYGMKLGALSAPRLLATCQGCEGQVDHLINDARVLVTCVIGCYENQLHSWI